ncbi:putative CmcJ-like methyltransferase [Lophiostoma macrostomum CBS 122681]|uniref:Putative CmcJ-like methyltransferase n=1 Tax=Lophiostoma macrostomum CBS 122681 TaxID=1314788 RepID=A0A6A6TCG4_9PLEO|nr:putative CmcJ-like methyltransferase [Lophiostoma macrostomum CBS 122681]
MICSLAMSSSLLLSYAVSLVCHGPAMGTAGRMPDYMESRTNFLRHDALYEAEKPYSLRFEPPPNFASSNIKLENHPITVRNIRACQSPPKLTRNGFGIVPFHSRMGYDDFEDDELVKEVYLREAADLLRVLLGANKVQIFEHTVRKQHETFPISTGEAYRWNQPTSIAHVDTTVQWAVDMAAQLNSDQPDITAERIQCVNLWKPIKGPVQDWPLALCDPESVDLNRDLEPCDLVYPDYVVENRQLHWNEEQKWWYCDQQQVDEAWVFLQSDTASTTKPVPHTAFPVEGHVGEARESIEVRALLYYGLSPI